MKKQSAFFPLFVALVTAALVSATSQVNAKESTFTGTVNVNTASLEELMQLPGIGETKARAIMEWRTKSPFQKVSDLLQVKGIGQKLFEKIQAYVSVAGPSTVGQATPRTPGAAGKSGQ